MNCDICVILGDDWLLCLLIQACGLPLCIPERHLIAAVVVCRRTPEIRFRYGFDQLPACVHVGHQTLSALVKQRLKMHAAHADIVGAVGNLKHLWFQYLLFGNIAAITYTLDGVHTLSEGNLMPALCPDGVIGQHEAHCHDILTAPHRLPRFLAAPRCHIAKYGQLIHLGGERRHVCDNRCFCKLLTL